MKEPRDILEGLLHPLSAFLPFSVEDDDGDRIDRLCEESAPTYLYEGDDPNAATVSIESSAVTVSSAAKVRLWLPRTVFVEEVARGLIRQLEADDPRPREGKMFGVLVVRDLDGRLGVLKAFSGLWEGQDRREGWVPPIPGREEVAEEEQSTLAALSAMKSRLIELADLRERAELAEKEAAYAAALAEKRAEFKLQKSKRDQQRALWAAGDGAAGDGVAEQKRLLEQESRVQKQALRVWMQAQEEALRPMRDLVEAADAEMRHLKQVRKQRSRMLQDRMYGAYRIANFSGISQPLEAFFTEGRMPTGTGDCCAPKLLHLAATSRLSPVGMAEFWWGPPPPNGGRISGEFYGACAERCQPIMGFLLSGLASPQSKPAMPESPREISSISSSRLGCAILYEDAFLWVVDKPAGLLSVPGRTQDRQDSVLGRLWLEAKHGAYIAAVHRLDELTSGILVFAREVGVYVALQRQFQERSVEKRYEALLCRDIAQEEGWIDLPLWGNPAERPLQRVDRERGKPARTRYQRLGLEADGCRVAFFPETGRTHQLRVHAADPAGLDAPICGDPLYGGIPAPRLFLHACALSFVHPITNTRLSLTSPVPF